jgi:cytochrome c553
MPSKHTPFAHLVLRSCTLSAACIALLIASPAFAAPDVMAPPAGLSTCQACHGAHGEGSTTGIPRLAGQDPGYLSKALAAFQAGTRPSTTMEPVARALDDAQVAALAHWFSTQHAARVEAVVDASPDRLAAGRQLAERGAAGVPACFSCHGVDGAGNGERYPRLAGQPARFVVGRLREFQLRAQQKAPAPDSMTAVAAALAPQQLEDAAGYFATLDR